MPRLIARLSTLALRAYPPEFRARYADQLLETIGDRFEKRSTEAGLLLAGAQFGGDLLDLFGGGMVERLRRNSNSPAPGGKKGGPLMGMTQDLHYALRVFRTQPGFVAVVVVTLGLGIGATTAMFSVLDTVILSQLPYENPDELVIVFETDRFNNTTMEGASGPDYHDFLERQTVFSNIAAWTTRNPTITDRAGEAERMTQQMITRDFFGTLGWAPALGRDFLPDEDIPGGPRVAIISDGLWKRRFGSDRGIVGSNLALDGAEYSIVGVMPEGFSFNHGTDVWVPLQSGPTTSPRGSHGLIVVARLREGESIQSANTAMNALMANLEELYPEDNVGRGANVMRLDEVVVGGVRPTLWILMGAVLLVLAITCANVANLLFSRAAVRQREMAVRSALGAGRFLLVRQLLTESVILAGAGGVAGVLLAIAGVPLIRGLNPVTLPRIDEVTLDLPVLVFAVVVTMTTGVVFGLLPALQSSRPDLQNSLSESSRSVAGGRGIVRATLAVSQVALAFVLVAGAGLLTKSASRLSAVDPGFNPAGLAQASISLPASRYPNVYRNWPESPEVKAFYSEVTTRLGATPGISGVTLAANSPVSAGWTTRVMVEGGPATVEDGLEESRIRPVLHNYFRVAEIPVVMGRSFNEFDTEQSQPMVIVNQAFAGRYFPDGSAVGRTVSFWGTEREIIGVVGDVKFMGLNSPSRPAVYGPLSQLPFEGFSIIVKTAGDPAAVLRTVAEQVRQIDPLLAVDGLQTMEGLIGGMLAPQRFTVALFGLFAALAFTLAVVGIYGVISYGVNQRVREFGIRMSLGADPATLGKLVAAQGLRLGAIGVAVGVVFALGTTRFLESILFEVSTLDPAVLAAVGGLLGLTALFAAAVPAFRASKTDPVVAMRD